MSGFRYVDPLMRVVVEEEGRVREVGVGLKELFKTVRLPLKLEKWSSQ